MNTVVVGSEDQRSRAATLRRGALGVNEILASSYKRRAAELEFEAWLIDLREGREVMPLAA